MAERELSDPVSFALVERAESQLPELTTSAERGGELRCARRACLSALTFSGVGDRAAASSR